MLEHTYTFRVQYPDTDKMGTMHHSQYAKYYETARWELFRNLGLSYQAIEDAGYLLPVIQMTTRFIKTTEYDALLTIHTKIKAMRGPRLWFEYVMYNEHKERINTAEIELAFVCKDTWKPCCMPKFVEEVLTAHIHENNVYL